MNSSRSLLPSINSLLAFERFAQLGNVTRAAEELHTSQAAISRHLKQLEGLLGVALVKPSGRGLILTSAGEHYFTEVSAALTLLRDAGLRMRQRSDELVVACTHEVSHLIIMPRFTALKKMLGRRAHIRVVTCEYDALSRVIETGVDIVFRYAKAGKNRFAFELVREQVMPLASPEFLERYRLELSRAPSEWTGIPRISLSKANSGWATWEDWFGWQNLVPPNAGESSFDNYVYALEAAARGEGLVLGWRWFADEYLASGRVVGVGPDWLQSDASLYTVLTNKGAANPLAQRFVTNLPKFLHAA